MGSYNLYCRLRISAAFATFIFILCISGCTSESFSPSSPRTEVSSFVEGVIQPDCQAGCVDTDSTPDADGYFLGGSATFTACTNGSQTDSAKMV